MSDFPLLSYINSLENQFGQQHCSLSDVLKIYAIVTNGESIAHNIIDQSNSDGTFFISNIKQKLLGYHATKYLLDFYCMSKTIAYYKNALDKVFQYLQRNGTSSSKFCFHLKIINIMIKLNYVMKWKKSKFSLETWRNERWLV